MLWRLMEREAPPVHGQARPAPPAAGYQLVNIHWYLDLDLEGRLKSFAGGGRRAPERVLAPYRQLTASRISPSLFVGSGPYVLGIPKTTATAARAERAHDAFVGLARRCAAEVEHPAIRAVIRFLDALDLSRPAVPEAFDPGDFVTFRVEGVRVFDLPGVREFWGRWLAESKTQEKTDLERTIHRPKLYVEQLATAEKRGQCLACGEGDRPIARVHDAKLKRVPGSVPSGSVLVSGSKEAAGSYGMVQGFIAPTCDVCADAYPRALNRLLGDESASLWLPEVAFVFWSDAQLPVSVPGVLKAEPAEVGRLLEGGPFPRAARRGQGGRVYAAALSAQGQRAQLLDWIECDAGDALANLRRYLFGQRITPAFGGDPRAFSIFDLAHSVDPEGLTSKLPYGEPKRLYPALVRCALAGGPLADWTLYLAVRCSRTQRGPFTPRPDGGIAIWPRAALMKLVLESQAGRPMGDAGGALDPSLAGEPAYLLGRLFGLLEWSESVVTGRVGPLATRDWYALASCSPELAFKSLMTKGFPAWIGRLATRPSRNAPWLMGALLDALRRLGPRFPRALDLRGQALFGLGYYYLRAEQLGAPRGGADGPGQGARDREEEQP